MVRQASPELAEWLTTNGLYFILSSSDVSRRTRPAHPLWFDKFTTNGYPLTQQSVRPELVEGWFYNES